MNLKNFVLKITSISGSLTKFPKKYTPLVGAIRLTRTQLSTLGFHEKFTSIVLPFEYRKL